MCNGLHTHTHIREGVCIQHGIDSGHAAASVGDIDDVVVQQRCNVDHFRNGCQVLLLHRWDSKPICSYDTSCALRVPSLLVPVSLLFIASLFIRCCSLLL